VTARLALDGVSYRAGATPILDPVTFAVEPGELIALVGRNGAGKSTLLNLVAGLLHANTGTVRLDGRPLAGWNAVERARRVCHLPQGIRGDAPFSTWEVVMMGRYPHADRWFESDHDRAAAEAAMRRTGCWELRERRVSTLSGGERQRVLLAACLAQEAHLLLLDEPSTFMDVDQQLHCFSLLREQTDGGAACLAVTHDLNLALAFATRLIVLAERSVVLDAPIAEAVDRPEWLGLFSSRLRLRQDVDGRRWVSFT
jgi:ABC-type cobalamin/Fe3+-siderophores transport system ATPase subunit